MADFKQAQEKVKKSEGGYQNLSWDSGNYTGGKVGVGSQIGTNWGISAPVLMNYLKRTPSIDDMKNLSYETALNIYKNQFWDSIKGDEIKNQSLAEMIYDGAVNQGVGRMLGIVSDSVAVQRPKTGKFNTEMVEKLNTGNPKEHFEDIKKRRLSAYNPSSPAYSAWLNRVNKIVYSGVEFVKKNPKKSLLGFVVLALAVGTTIYYVRYKNRIEIKIV